MWDQKLLGIFSPFYLYFTRVPQPALAIINPASVPLHYSLQVVIHDVKENTLPTDVQQYLYFITIKNNIIQ